MGVGLIIDFSIGGEGVPLESSSTEWRVDTGEKMVSSADQTEWELEGILGCFSTERALSGGFVFVYVLKTIAKI